MRIKYLHILLLTLIVIGSLTQSGGYILCYLENDHLAVETGDNTHCSHHMNFLEDSIHTVTDAYSHRHGIHIDLPLTFLDSSYLDRTTGKDDVAIPPVFTAFTTPSPLQVSLISYDSGMFRNTSPLPHPALPLQRTTVIIS